MFYVEPAQSLMMLPVDLPSVTDVVLFSGGWESTLCAIKAREYAWNKSGCPLLLFYNYQQRYLREELTALAHIADTLQLRYRIVELVPGFFERRGKVVVGRNEHFIRVSRRIAPNAQGVWFGCRAPSAMFDTYGDSNVDFAIGAGSSAGYSRVHCPAALMPKWLVRRRVKLAMTNADSVVFSSEGLMA